MDTRLILFVVALLVVQGWFAASAVAGAAMVIDGVDELSGDRATTRRISLLCMRWPGSRRSP